ncbi:MAG: transglycosylase SLT domain-containing protein, partial [Muribaculaceae bacterium]|nr:transglycosylase SLT domain-containing protein [Muribaculaceae bacterium]
MNLIRKYLVFTAISATAVIASARPSVLSLADHVNDSTIIYPESVETDVHKMMQNWYLENYTALDKEADYRPDVPTTDQEIIERLRTMPTAIEMPFNSVVRNYIDMYTGKKRSLIESMLGMSLYYMPIFEEALEREGIPNELKYLPVIESALNPDAVSRAGATGLWQIMLPTARGLGLEVNALIDERRDPVRSSEAATKYLRQLYEIYNDWSLAIAAYNCGPGNVNKALRRCEGDDKKDFWTIYPYLPAETRGYVPCFIAANYAMNYYNKHNISPALAKRPIITDSVHVNRRIHFRQIADILQIPVEEIQILNPQYRKQEIPGDIRPCPLVLPANQIYAYIMSEKAIGEQNAASYARRDVVEPANGLE